MIDSAEFANFDISVVIPAMDTEDYLPALLKSIESQTLLPREIVIVDSSVTSRTANIVKKWIGIVPISYHKVDFAFPGHARNIGVNESKGEWIAFLDSTTVPEHDWLERCVEVAIEKKVDFVGGRTLIEADTYFKKLLQATSYGCSSHGTLPGSIVKKEVFCKSGGFISNIRSGEDIEWMERMNTLGFKMKFLKEPVIRYHGFPDSLWLALKKYYKYAMAGAQTDVFKGQKTLYMSVALILLTILVYKWNKVITDFNQDHILYIPHITKIYFGSLVALYAITKIFMKPWYFKIKLGVFEKVYLSVLVVLTTGLFYRWNYIFANFNVHSIFYIPHVTKIYIASLFILSVFFRGIIRPLSRNVKLSFVFPINWILIGLIGVTLDVVKAPGYIWGAILAITGKTISRRQL